MLYSDYYKRMSKVMTFAGAVKKHLIVILISLSAILAVIATLLATRGLVYDKDDCPAQIEYGQSISYTAGAFLAGDISYEYRAEGGSEWKTVAPTRAGKYYVRAVSSRIGGAPSYGKEHAITVLPKKIEVSVGGKTVFGDNPSVAAELCYGDNIDCTEFFYADPSRSSTTVSAVASAVVITDKNGEDVTDCYDIATPACPIEFTPRKIGITVADKTVEYDNTPIAFGGYELSDGTLAAGNMIVCVADTTLTDVGEVSVSPKFCVLNGDGVDVSANYNISQSTGKISVTQRIVCIKSKSDEAVYDGNSFSCADYELTDGTSLVSGHRLSLELQSSITDAGSSENMMAFKVFDGDKDITGNYSIVLTAGTLTVTPRPLTVKSVDKAWEYDGTVHSEAAIENNAVGLLTGKGHSINVEQKSAVITDVGTTDNTVTVTVQAADGADITSNYKINYDYGTLTVTPRALNIKSVDGLFTYDGTAQGKAAIESADGLLDGHKAQADITDGAYSTITEVGTADNDIAVIVSDADGVIKTANYKIEYTSGTLTMNARPITVKAADVSREYDGTPFASNGYEITSDNKLVLNHTGEAVCTGEITDVGTEKNTVTDFTVFDGEDDVTRNYEVSFDESIGTLTVTRREITVGSVDETFDYDGTAHSKNEIDKVERLIDGHTASVKTEDGAYSTITDVGTADNSITVTVADGQGTDKTDNYKIVYKTGTLTVTPRPVTVKSVSLSKIYDATPLIGESDDFEVTEGSFVLDHEGSAYYDIGRIGVGEMPNVIDEFYVLSGDKDVTKNYSITISEEQGTLTVTPRPIKVVANDKDVKFVYDGKLHSYFDCTAVPVEPLSADDEAIVGGQKMTKISRTELRDVRYDELGNVTSVPNDMFVVIRDGDDVKTQNYSIEYDLGTITITPRPITVKAGSDSKIYDGTPLTSDKFEVTSELKIVDGQTGVAECSGSITEVLPSATQGTADNIIEHSFKIYEGTAEKTFNYAIEYDSTPGVLTVTPRPISARTEAHTFMYDGDAHDWQHYSVQPYIPPLTSDDVAIISGHHTEIVESTVTKVTDVARNASGKVIGVPNEFIIKVFDENDVDKSYNYHIEYTFAELTVTPRPITVTTESEEFLYDNTDHGHAVYTVAKRAGVEFEDSYDPILSKHKSEAATFTTVHDVMRESESFSDSAVIGTDNVITVVIKDKQTSADKTYNYDITYIYGELTVNPRPITVTTWSQEFMYDDTEHSCLSYTISVRAPLTASEPGILSVHEPRNFIITSVRDVKRDEFGNVASYENKLIITIVNRTNRIDQAHNYDIQYVYGTLTVTPRPIEITTGSQSWIFDGIYHNNVDYSARALFTLKDGESALANGQKIVLVNRPVAVRDVKRDKDGNVIGYANNSALKIVRESNNAATTDNYDIKYVYGTLKITPRHITVKSGHDEFIDGVNSWVYDGDYHQDIYAEIVDTVCDDAPPEELEKTGLVEGHEMACFFSGAYKVNRDNNDYGYINRVFVISIRPIGTANIPANEDMQNYQIHYIYGKLRILPRPVTVYTTDRVWMYDGQPHSDYTVTVDENTPLANNDWIERDEASVCEITEVGKKHNKFDIAIHGFYDSENMAGDFIATDCYDITFVYGELEIVEGEGENGDDNEHGNIGGGDLGGGNGNGEPTVILTISTDYKGSIYLRQSSYGDYVLGQKVSFLDAEEFNGLMPANGKYYGMNYMPSTILRSSISKYYINIELSDKGCFVIPYFAAFGDSQIQTSDVWYYLRGDDLSYTVNFYPYMYTSDNGAALSGGVARELSALESEYYSFVLSKYLQIPTSTKRYMDGIIAAQKLSIDDADIIAKVAKFIQDSASYNLEYDSKLDNENDIVVEFLRKYKEGVCRHYAAAATMLFRALGIPARYVCGVLANGDGSGNPIHVMSDRAHAWTEVYIAGVGWVPVEVTGSSSLGGGGGNLGDGEFIPSLTIKPIDVYSKTAPAKPINAVIQVDGSIDLNYLTKNQGFYYEVVIEQTSPGVSEIKSFKLYNRVGMDVTSELGDRITFLPGKLVVTNKKHITVIMSRVEQTYNGMPLGLLDDDYYVLDAPAGYTVTLDLSKISITAAGKVTTEDLREMLDAEYGQNNWYTVLNESGADVTSEYFISFIGDTDDDSVAAGLRTDTSIMMVLEVSKKRVTFTSLSKSKKYDGTPLEAEVIYSQSELAAGHKAVITKTVSITDVGEVESTFIVKIVDAAGTDVTDNYLIEKNIGNLTVTE